MMTILKAVLFFIWNNRKEVVIFSLKIYDFLKKKVKRTPKRRDDP